MRRGQWRESERVKCVKHGECIQTQPHESSTRATLRAMSSDSDSSCDDRARLDVDTVQSKEAKLAEREFSQSRGETAARELQREIIRMEKKVSAMVLVIDKRSKELTLARGGASLRTVRSPCAEDQRYALAAMCIDAGKPLR